MEFFSKAKVVRLQSHNGKYLLAGDDEESIYQDRNGVSMNARWMVEIVEPSQALRFKSCYGKYLTATNKQILLGMTGKKVQQTLPQLLDSSLEWEPVREGFQVRLKSCTGHFLRANGGVPPWRNSVTHDTLYRIATQDWTLWDVDVLELRELNSKHRKRPPPILPPAHSPICSDFFSPSSSPSPTRIFGIRSPSPREKKSSASSPACEGRVIYFHVAREESEVYVNDNQSFKFLGWEVEELKEKLKELTGIYEDILVCSRNPLNGKLYALRLQLPPNTAFMHVVVVPSSSRAATAIINTPMSPTPL